MPSAIRVIDDHGLLTGLSDDDHAQYLLASGTRALSGDLSAGSNRITTLLDPSSAQDAATKNYVDTAVGAVVQGVDPKDSVRVASTGNVDISAPGAAIDGVTMATNDRVLLKNQTDPAENGIYLWNGAATPMTRTADANTSAEVTGGMFVFVTEGTTNADSGWVLTTNDPITLGTTGLTFVQFSVAGQITAGSGLTKTGNTLDVGAGNGITVGVDSISLNEAYAPTWTAVHTFRAADGVSPIISKGTGSVPYGFEIRDSANTILASLSSLGFSLINPLADNLALQLGEDSSTKFGIVNHWKTGIAPAADRRPLALSMWAYGTGGVIIGASGTGAPITFATATTERMRIDEDGNVGINCDPNYILDIRRSNNLNETLHLGNVNAGGAAGTAVVLSEDVATNKAGGLFYANSGFTPSGTNLANQLQLVALAGATGGMVIRTNANAPIIFATNGLANERVRVNGTGQIIAGGQDSQALRFAQKIESNSSADYGGIALNTWSADTKSSIIDLNKSRSSAVGTKTAVQLNDGLGGIFFNGADGTNFIQAALIAAYSDGAPGTNVMPGRLEFSVNAGAASVTKGMSLYSSGNFLVGPGTITSGVHFEFRRDQNAATFLYCNNQTAGTAAAAYFVVSSDTATGAFLCTSGSFTASGLALPDQVTLQASASASNGLVLKTNTAAHIYLGTNNAERHRIDGTSGDWLASTHIVVNVVGKGLKIKEGSNATMGVATLSLGTVTVNTTAVTANSRIMLTKNSGASGGAVRVSARVAGTSFTITSSDATDSGTVAWIIFEPAA